MTHPLVKKYNLEPHPEGGFYRQVFRSDNRTSSYVHNESRPALTHIYFLLLKAKHRISFLDIKISYTTLQTFKIEGFYNAGTNIM